jgi:hypothetical protein
MDHNEAVRLQATERYLLRELNPEQLDQFEEHLFDCQDCAVDLRAATMFLEQTKNVLSEAPATTQGQSVASKSELPARKSWFRWLKPAFALPVLAGLLAVMGYQNLVTYPRLHSALNHPQVMPWASVNVGTYGEGGPVIVTPAGKGFLLFMRIPPEGAYSHYIADLYNPAGKLEWSLTIPAAANQDQWPVQVPAANLPAGTYTLVIHGINAIGESKDLGRASFELQIDK